MRDFYGMQRRAVLGGRWRVFWLTHGARTRELLGVAFVFLAFGLVGRWDLEAALALERARAERAESINRATLIAGDLPSTVFIVDGKTPREAAQKLFEASQALDLKYSQWLAHNMGGGK